MTEKIGVKLAIYPSAQKDMPHTLDVLRGMGMEPDMDSAKQPYAIVYVNADWTPGPKDTFPKLRLRIEDEFGFEVRVARTFTELPLEERKVALVNSVLEAMGIDMRVVDEEDVDDTI